MTISSWLNFGRPAPWEGGLRRGENFWLRLTTASVQCLRLLWALFHYIQKFISMPQGKANPTATAVSPKDVSLRIRIRKPLAGFTEALAQLLSEHHSWNMSGKDADHITTSFQLHCLNRHLKVCMPGQEVQFNIFIISVINKHCNCIWQDFEKNDKKTIY